MASKIKIQKKNKALFTIISDRLCEDSSQECFGTEIQKGQENALSAFEFPLDIQLQQIHQNPQNLQLSTYIKYLESQVKSTSNDIEYQYHQSRQTVFYIGQINGLSKLINRKKIDDEFQKMGVIRKYNPKVRHIQDATCDYAQQEIAKNVGQLAIKQLKKKIQIQWESELCQQIEKQRRRLRQMQKKKQKQLEQIDKDFEKLMKKRKTIKQQQVLLKVQQPMHNSHQSIQSSSQRTPKKAQKRTKIERKTSQKNKQKQGNNIQQKSGSQLQAQSSSIMVNNNVNGNNNLSGECNSQQINENEILDFESNGEVNNIFYNSNNDQWKHNDVEILKINNLAQDDINHHIQSETLNNGI